ncbi:glutaminase A [Cryobacterium zongtaii]|uniref:Glutaminase n=1 Tax=Cryobacterium zongtaii TaxID=1259217 RepID=A0A2S3Z6S6_9MICO|nr:MULTISPECIES: glutaminase A [Cryobacterium]ASD20844.1 glutaminase A [Cryobacterium sp. LW097]POH60885.1 glutaminase A [Cryobacterium zongtaii]TFC52508.1 glutaminase A [Cryobacterium sp. TMB3-1-2]TFC61326.1 glutaminase A [Cryobacterium sp. TMB1-7]TFC66441.1 glutaminase A [Cryobacterium sp. TMB3-15]
MSRSSDPRTYDLDSLRDRVVSEAGGAVDDSIPQLADADPGLCGIALVLPDGTVRSSAQADVLFSVQSAVKPFLFALALLDTHGEAFDRIGIEPTGEAFDAIKLESGTGRPPNPMVNAGALLTAALVDGDDVAARNDRILRGLSAFAGRPLEVDEGIARTEHLLGDRNHALAHLMRSEGTLRVSADDAVEVYARACAVLVDARALAVMGATLACRGVNPVTGERVVPAGIARDVVSVMATCGVYDGSGRWMQSVGIPAKSSVSGAIVLAAPGRLGAAVVSPPLDAQGTSVRGRLVSDRLSVDLGLHAFG